MKRCHRCDNRVAVLNGLCKECYSGEAYNDKEPRRFPHMPKLEAGQRRKCRDQGAKHDARYHGGRGNGEW